MPYLTPQELPEGDDCRPLSIPADSEWLALFGGALTELTKTWNWEDSGGLTVNETVEKMLSIVDAWYAAPCDQCELPEGGAIIRIGEDGLIEELIDGEWVAPTGDYIIPDPEAREGGDPGDQICLAAKNATNVLEQLYESLSESWSGNLAEAEALTDFVAVLVTVVGFEFAPISFGVAAFFLGLFRLLYRALEYLGADLWDEDFSAQIRCFLVDCAANDAGVVTFDYECFTNKLNSLVNTFGLSEVQVRLYLQLAYMLYFIGGAKGLNLAGATTAITDDDCSDCTATWCFVWDFTIDDGDWTGVSGTNWVSGQGWTGVNLGSGSRGWAYIHKEFDPVDITQVGFYYCKSAGSGGNDAVGTVINLASVQQFIEFPGGAPTHGCITNHFWDVTETGDQVYFNVNSGDTVTTVYITRAVMRGTGECPFGDPNC